MEDGGKRCSCGAGCKTFGECIRNKGLRIAYCQSAAGKDATAQKRWDSELAAYASARKEGIQPAGTKIGQITAARSISDKTGTAYQAG